MRELILTGSGLDWEQRKRALREHGGEAGAEAYRQYVSQGEYTFPRTHDAWGVEEFIVPDLQDEWLRAFGDKIEKLARKNGRGKE